MGNEAAIRLRQLFSATEAVNIPLLVARRGKRGLRPSEEVDRYRMQRGSRSEWRREFNWSSLPIDDDIDPCYDYLDMRFEIFATYLLPQSEAPTWCNFRSKGSSIKLAVPSYPDNTKILGLNVCCVYTLLHSQGSCYDNGEGCMTSVNNTSTGWLGNNMNKWVIGVTKITGDIMELSYWKSTGGYIDEIRSGDKLCIQVFTNNEYFKVKEIGARIVSKNHGEGDSEEKQVCTIGEPCASIHIHIPDNFIFKLNCHRYLHGRDGDRDGIAYHGAAYGGVLRDGEGKWILGYYGHSKPFIPESKIFTTWGYKRRASVHPNSRFWVIYQGLKIIEEKGWSNVLIQTDDWGAVRELHNTTTSALKSRTINNISLCSRRSRRFNKSRGNRMINKILSLSSGCNCTLSYIIPERNKLTQLIAKLARKSDGELVVLENPPNDPEIKGILLEDVKMKFT